MQEVDDVKYLEVQERRRARCCSIGKPPRTQAQVFTPDQFDVKMERQNYEDFSPIMIRRFVLQEKNDHHRDISKAQMHQSSSGLFGLSDNEDEDDDDDDDDDNDSKFLRAGVLIDRSKLEERAIILSNSEMTRSPI